MGLRLNFHTAQMVMRTEKTEQQISSKRDATQKNGDEQTQSGFVKK